MGLLWSEEQPKAPILAHNHQTESTGSARLLRSWLRHWILDNLRERAVALLFAGEQGGGRTSIGGSHPYFTPS